MLSCFVISRNTDGVKLSSVGCFGQFDARWRSAASCKDDLRLQNIIKSFQLARRQSMPKNKPSRMPIPRLTPPAIHAAFLAKSNIILSKRLVEQ